MKCSNFSYFQSAIHCIELPFLYQNFVYFYAFCVFKYCCMSKNISKSRIFYVFSQKIINFCKAHESYKNEIFYDISVSTSVKYCHFESIFHQKKSFNSARRGYCRGPPPSWGIKWFFTKIFLSKHCSHIPSREQQKILKFR